MNNSTTVETEIKRVWLYELRATLSHSGWESEVLQWEDVILLTQKVLQRYAEIIGSTFDGDKNILFLPEGVENTHIKAPEDIMSIINRNFIFLRHMTPDGIKSELLKGDHNEDILCTTYPNGTICYETLWTPPTDWKIHLTLEEEDDSVSIKMGDEKNPDYITITGFKKYIGEILHQEINNQGIVFHEIPRKTPINDIALFDEILGIEPMSKFLKEAEEKGYELYFPRREIEV